MDRAQAISQTKPGTVGIKVSILAPGAVFKDKIEINKEVIANLKQASNTLAEDKE